MVTASSMIPRHSAAAAIWVLLCISLGPVTFSTEKHPALTKVTLLLLLLLLLSLEALSVAKCFILCDFAFARFASLTNDKK